MAVASQLINTLHIAKEQKRTLTEQETIKVLEALGAISQNPLIIERVLTLFVLMDSNISIKKLSERESQIFNLIGCDCTTKEVSKILSISEATVSTHRKNIIKKLNIKGTNKLHLIARQHLSQYLKMK